MAKPARTSEVKPISNFPKEPYGAPSVILVSSASSFSCCSISKANFMMMSLRWVGGTLFHAGKAFSPAATAASTSSAPARATSSATKEPSLGLYKDSFLEFLASTYSLLMKSCLGRFVLEKVNAIVAEYVVVPTTQGTGRTRWQTTSRRSLSNHRPFGRIHGRRDETRSASPMLAGMGSDRQAVQLFRAGTWMLWHSLSPVAGHCLLGCQGSG
jgi:hypothetical protein